MLKHVIDKNKPQIKPFILDEDVVVYSGRYITAETEEDLQKAYNIFKSEEFARYCAIVGKNKSGGYVEVSTKAVKEFGVKKEQGAGLIVVEKDKKYFKKNRLVFYFFGILNM